MTGTGSAGVMQPYVLPYLGYFHLIEATDRFIFYDDVNYRPRTWMNRNRILVQGAPHTFTVPVTGGSQNTAIRDVHVDIDERWRRKFFATLTQGYARAPWFAPVTDLLDSVLRVRQDSLADLAIESIASVYAYLGRPFSYDRSSLLSPESVALGRAERLAHLTVQAGCATYVNLPSGRELYAAEDFAPFGVELRFVQSEPPTYEQPGAAEFVPSLSVVDVLMCNSPEQVSIALGAFTLAS